MEKYFFLPYWLKWIGFPVAVLLLLLIVCLEIQPEQSAVFISGLKVPEELIYALLLLALFILFFSKEKSDNQFVSQLKAEALIVAVGINYLVLMIGLVLSYNSWNALDLLFYSTCSLFLFWLLIFYLKKRSHKKGPSVLSHEQDCNEGIGTTAQTIPHQHECGQSACHGSDSDYNRDKTTAQQECHTQNNDYPETDILNS